jgi:hypothetical protein
MASYRKFSDALKNGNYALAPPNSPKASKADTLGGLGALDGPRPEAQKPAAAPESAELIAPSPAPTLATLAALAAHARESRDTGAGPDAELIAPSPWFESVARPSEGEPGFEHPWPARRGRVGEEAGVVLHFCAVCGRWGAYGYGVNLRAGRLGHWYCAAHRPKGTVR